ncbi:hypothetical protein SCG7109_AG_00090 [Chlamydiales bacterium SCGC AG-110-M15]|nr:hypothetical protein SCG7109_AG_00090 [Chlamydiales bacterium SCGC AG-110-M15]
MTENEKNKKESQATRLEMNRSGFAVLMMEVKALQGVSGVYNQFENEYKTLGKQIKAIANDIDEEIPLSEKLNIVEFARGFFQLTKQVHPYPHHLEDILENMGANKHVYIKTAVLERFLHSLDRVAPSFFQSHLHKTEVKQVIIQTLEDCYDEIEDLEEEAELGENTLLLDKEE